MGESALTSHGKGTKHQKLLANLREENRKQASFFTKDSSSKPTSGSAAPATAHEPPDAPF